MPVEDMLKAEAAVKEEVLIVAEDRVVRQLVESTFSTTTLSNLRRGVRYRFLVSRQSSELLQPFVEAVCRSLPTGRRENLQVKAVDNAAIKVFLPGCIFDPRQPEHHRAYFRQSRSAGYFWLCLSESQREAYTEGFESMWTQPVAVGALQARADVWRFLALLMTPSGLLVFLSGWAVYRQALLRYPLVDAAKSLFLVAVSGLGLWLLLALLLGHATPRVSRTPFFRLFQKLALYLLTAVVIGLGVNLISSWLTQ